MVVPPLLKSGAAPAGADNAVNSQTKTKILNIPLILRRYQIWAEHLSKS